MPQDTSLNFASDPAAEAYEVIARALKGISWREFEDFLTDLMREAGFLDVQRLTPGSQQGKDVVGVWPSRFHLGMTVRFRFQAKHKEKADYLTKAEVGDSLADFLAQDVDKALLVFTNGKLSNDLIDQLDRILQNGRAVEAIAGERLLRLAAAYPLVALKHLGLTAECCENVRHHFEFAQCIENLASFAEWGVSKFSFYRFWSDPYAWFFYKDAAGKVIREWTTHGGDFRFNCYNPTDEIQNIGRITLKLLDHQELPEQAVINISPKGGHDIRKVEVVLSKTLGTIQLNDSDPTVLGPRSNFSCLVVFKNAAPGIYRFQVRAESQGGSQAIRESPIYTIVSLPVTGIRDSPPNSISLYQAWPQSLPIVYHLLNLPRDEFELLRNQHKTLAALTMSSRDGKLTTSFESRTFEKTVGQSEVQINSPFDRVFERAQWIPLRRLIRSGGEGGDPIKRFGDFVRTEDWIEEFLDPSEPLGVHARAHLLEQSGAPTAEVLSVIEKAYERRPDHAKFSAWYACHCLALGYLGHAKFYMDCANVAAPENPIIAALAYSLRLKLDRTPPDRADFESVLTPEHVKVFQIVCAHIAKTNSFPQSYFEAASAPFSDSPELGERWSDQRW